MLLLALSSGVLAYSPLMSVPAWRCLTPSMGSCFQVAHHPRHCPAAARVRSGCIVAMAGDDQTGLNDAQIETIFKEFDTSGDGFIDVNELQAALAKAGKPISPDRCIV